MKINTYHALYKQGGQAVGKLKDINNYFHQEVKRQLGEKWDGWDGKSGKTVTLDADKLALILFNAKTVIREFRKLESHLPLKNRE
jgi:hypothetical protein